MCSPWLFCLLLSHRDFVVGLQMCLGAQLAAANVQCEDSTAARVYIEATVFEIVTQILLLLCSTHKQRSNE